MSQKNVLKNFGDGYLPYIICIFLLEFHKFIFLFELHVQPLQLLLLWTNTYCMSMFLQELFESWGPCDEQNEVLLSLTSILRGEKNKHLVVSALRKNKAYSGETIRYRRVLFWKTNKETSLWKITFECIPEWNQDAKYVFI